jgi:photosystem II stability/assembly factor-like uncharacterized protein
VRRVPPGERTLSGVKMHSDLDVPPRRRAAITALLLLAVCAAFPATVLAGVNEWTQIGPDGGWLCGMAAAPSNPAILYARGGNLFRSSDGGATWEPRSGSVDSLPCYLQVDVEDPLRLYGFDSGTFLRSLDGGASWSPSSEGLSDLESPTKVAVDLHDANFLIFVSDEKIFRSTDRAASWSEIAGPPDVIAQWIEVDPWVAGSLWLMTAEGTVYRSFNAGDTWAMLDSDLPSGLRFAQLEFDPNDPSLVYLGAFRSRDGGAHWVPIPVPGNQNLTVGEDSILYGFETGGIYFRPLVYRSEDRGDTWQLLPSGPFTFIPRYGGLWLFATEGGLFAGGELSLRRSFDNGDSWQDATSGLSATFVRGFEIDRQNPEALFAIDEEGRRAQGLIRSEDRGETWVRSGIVPQDGHSILADVAVDPQDSRHLLVVKQGAFSGEPSGLLESRDGGVNWILKAVPNICISDADLEFDPLNSSRLLLVRGLVAPPCWSYCDAQVSVDGGESWQCSGLQDDLTSRASFSPFAEGPMLAVGSFGIYRSTDSGGSWIRAAENPTIPGAPENALAHYNDIEWVSPATVYATNEGGGLYRSQDAGQTWAPLTAPQDLAYPWLGELAVDRFHPLEVFALAKTAVVAPAFTEVVRSRDGGLTWESLSVGLLGWDLSELRLDPVTPNRLYVSAANGGVLAYDLQNPEPCVPSATALCITDGRFKLESLWRDFAGNSGVGHAVPLAADTGAFWFFDPDNLELFAKEIDGTGYNNAFWTFYGALSNVEFTLLATDTATGAQHGYFNRSTQFASRGDIESFPQEVSVAASTPLASPARLLRPARAAVARSANACVPNATTLCLADGRFAASVTWRDFAGRTGVGTPIVLTPDTGSFWFFDAGIHELAVKVIDGRGTNNAYWVFYGSLSNVEFELTVVDTTTGEIWTRENPSGTFASNGDIEAFPQ